MGTVELFLFGLFVVVRQFEINTTTNKVTSQTAKETQTDPMNETLNKT